MSDRVRRRAMEWNDRLKESVISVRGKEKAELGGCGQGSDSVGGSGLVGFELE